MTAADLSASAKPWEIQTETVKGIFEEFYEQGDEERSAGREPMAMMDRYQPDQQAFSQVTIYLNCTFVAHNFLLNPLKLGFLNGICIPCYSLLYRLIPETKPMLKQCQENFCRWQTIDEKSKKKDTAADNKN